VLNSSARFDFATHAARKAIYSNIFRNLCEQAQYIIKIERGYNTFSRAAPDCICVVEKHTSDCLVNSGHMSLSDSSQCVADSLCGSCDQEDDMELSLHGNGLHHAFDKVVDSSDRCYLFELPRELRDKILLYFVVIEAERFLLYWRRNYTLSLQPFPGNKNNDGRDERALKLRLIYWGMKPYASIFPICQQWYTEIQLVIYTRFRFIIWRSIFDDQAPDLSFGLGFLPCQSFTMIRHIQFGVTLYFHLQEEDVLLQNVTQGCRDVAVKLPNLKSVKFSLELFLDRSHSAIGRYNYIPKERKSFARDVLLSFSRPFLHVETLKIKSIHFDPDHLPDGPRDECEEGFPFERVILECRAILQQEKITGISNTCALPSQEA